jgi:hypothetical protein
MELLKYTFSQPYLIIIIVGYILFMLYKLPKYKKLKIMYSYLKKSDEKMYNEINDIESSMGGISMLVLMMWSIILIQRIY